MGRSVVEGLEQRRLLAADLSVTVTTTLPLTLDAGATVKAAKATVTVKNIGTAVAKKTAGSVPVTVVLHPNSGGADITLGKASIQASAFAAGKPITVNVPLKLAKAPAAAGSYSLIARIAPPAGLGDTDTENNQAYRSVTVSGGNNGGTSQGALSSIGYGSKLTFKKTGGIDHNGTGYETGTFKDEKGKTGSFYLTTAGNGLKNGLMAFKDANGAPVALTPIYSTTGVPRVGGKTLTFGGAAAGAKGYIELAGATIYYR